MIAALLRRFRARKARAQASWMTGYITGRYGEQLLHERQRQQALAAWEKHKP